MTPGRSGRSLGERAANSGVRPAPEPAPSRGPEVAEGRHCWVRNPPQAPGTWPGLLVEWRQDGGGWQGRVVFAVGTPTGPTLVEAWLPADRLQPR
jgi:hypothetical protein